MLRKKKLFPHLAGLEPATFRLTAERANRLRHKCWPQRKLLRLTFSKMKPRILPSSHLAHTINMSAIGELVILCMKITSLLHHYIYMCNIPWFGSIQYIGMWVWIADCSSFHSTRVTAVVRLRQTKTTNQITSSWKQEWWHHNFTNIRKSKICTFIAKSDVSRSTVNTWSSTFFFLLECV